MSPVPPSPPFETLTERFSEWERRLHDSGWSEAAAMLLDLVEPLAPLGAGVLYVAQPIAGWIGWRDAVGDLAQVLETPGGVPWLRAVLHLETESEKPE